MQILATAFLFAAAVSGINVVAQELTVEDKTGPRPHQASQTFGKISVQVRDERDRPVPQAAVTFRIQPGKDSAAGARFDNNQTVFITHTGPDGTAETTPLRANGSAGPFEIVATAQFASKKGDAVIPLSNDPRPIFTKRRTILAGAAAAAVVIPVLALRSPPPPKATISTVTPTGPVGSP